MHRAVALRSSPTNTHDQIDFDITLLAAHDKYNPYSAHGLKSGLGHKDVSLIAWDLAQLADRSRRGWTLRSEADVAEVTQQVEDAFRHFGLPLLQRMASLEGIVSLYAERGESAGFMPRSWALLQLGKRTEALSVIQAEIAKATSPRAKERAFEWLARIDE
jgi:hypothetical protein